MEHTASAGPPDVLRFPHPVMAASALGRRAVKAFVILGKRYVLFRDGAGKAVAVPGACPHRGASLAEGKVNAAGELVCAYHGWRICADGTAVSAAVPDRSCSVAVLKTWERYGFIWVANADVPDTAFPAFIDPAYRLIGHFTTPFNVPLRVVLDNFGEIEHAYQVHSFIGPHAGAVDKVTFSSVTGPDETCGYSSCAYRSLPLGLQWFFGIKRGDHYHNDWVFRFKPLHGSYRNYWTLADGSGRRPVSFIVTTFLVPTSEREVNMHVFLQTAIASPLLKWIAPILNWFAMAITRYEIKADAAIARFAPESDEGGRWHLTHFDKQLFTNRKLLDSIYLGRGTAHPSLPQLPAEVAAAADGTELGRRRGN